MTEAIKTKLNNKIKFAYGFADFGFLAMVNLSNFYLLTFLTVVVKLSPVTAGIIMTGGRILDTISVPILGPVIEKSKMKWGKYRSWLIIGSILVFIFNSLLFVNLPNFFGQTGVIIAGIFIYALFCIAGNAAYIAFTSLNSALTTDPKEKVTLSTIRGIGNALGKIFAGWAILPLVYFFGKSEDFTTTGFFWVAVLFGALTTFTYLTLVAATKGVADAGVEKDASGKAVQVTVKDMLMQIKSNRPALMILIADTARILATLLLFATIPIFFIFVVGDPTKIMVFFGMVNFLLLGGSLTVPLLKKFFTKRTIYLSGMLLMVASFTAMYLNAHNANAVIIFASIGFIGYALANVINTAMYADASEYGLYKTGINARAVVFSSFQLSIKIAATLSVSISAFGLALIGFQEGVAPTAEVVAGIKNIAMFFPTAFVVISIIALLFYNIDDKKLAEMKAAYEAGEGA
ncbi:MAG: glycoside-pentoside-hexuronide (GPH):cation symporter [Chloroflexota bacterium]